MKTFKILSIDGGGVRGIIPATILQDLEARTGRPIAESFDLIAGTSTGGFMSLLLTKPGKDGRPLYSAQDIVDLYLNHAKDIFHAPWWHRILSLNGWIRPKYPSRSPRSTFDTYLNQHGPHNLTDALTDVLITSYEIEKRDAFYFQRCEARRNPDWDFIMADVAQSTTAAPYFFPAVRITSTNGKNPLALIDGGLVANNPSLLALAEAIEEHGKEDIRYLVVSLGTGTFEEPIPYGKAKGWGLLQWAKPVPDVLFDGNAHLVDTACREIVEGLDAQIQENRGQGGAPAPGYFRLQVALDAQTDGTDNVDPANLAALQAATRSMLKDREADLAEIARQLQQP